MNLLKYFKKETNYPPQVIPPKVRNIIEQLDNGLIENRTNQYPHFTITRVQLSIMDQFKTIETMTDYVLKNITPDYYYIPRSIAFTISADGTWNFFIGLYYKDERDYPEIVVDMFTDLLTRTNNARI